MFKTKRYDDETLKHLQKVQLMMLKDFIKICEDNDILYFMNGGSLLGTIRHGGFIPWDDDIDIMMFRKDFDKLNEFMKNNPNDKYHLIDVLNEETYHYTWARFNLKNTELREWWADQVDYKVNIFMDIFIIYDMPKNRLKKFTHKWRCFALNQLVQYSLVKFENESKIKQFIQQSIYYILKVIPISPTTIKKRCIKTYRKYDYEECEELCDFPALVLLPIYKKKDWLPAKKAKFEDITVNIPNNPDAILTIIYGDYMKLPPEDKRFRPAPEKLDFGEY
ncbi:MAG: LicD family protein [Methanobrevibacter millerae]|uniref:LicD family protein n=1 Tax=Methanobrevibacter millerae TaxID=230361 RepID=A0A8T3VGL7_9EURY|nr:LicD family protein [Methanobrevibacter millerae]